jgi:hypothetical protein
MIRLKVTRVFAVLLLWSAVWMLAQPVGFQTPPPPPKPQFFAGIVTDLNSEHVTVSRSLFGRPPEKRTFLIGPKTKLSRPLKMKARVTVRYQHLPEGDVALEVQVRSQARPLRPS